MPERKQEKLLCVEALRHSEYYDMQGVFDELYEKSLAGEEFTDLMGLILSRENILLAYRNIKANIGSNTPGTDKLTIKDIGILAPDTVIERVRSIINGKWGYRPRPVRRREIPKPDGNMRPLGIAIYLLSIYPIDLLEEMLNFEVSSFYAIIVYFT